MQVLEITENSERTRRELRQLQHTCSMQNGPTRRTHSPLERKWQPCVKLKHAKSIKNISRLQGNLCGGAGEICRCVCCFFIWNRMKFLFCKFLRMLPAWKTALLRSCRKIKIPLHMIYQALPECVSVCVCDWAVSVCVHCSCCVLLPLLAFCRAAIALGRKMLMLFRPN